MEVVDIESYLKSTANWGGGGSISPPGKHVIKMNSSGLYKMDTDTEEPYADAEIEDEPEFELLAADMVLSDWLASLPHKPEPEDPEELALQECGVELVESDKHGRDDLEEVGGHLDSLESELWIDPEYTPQEKNAIRAFVKEPRVPMWFEDLEELPYRYDKKRHFRSSVHIGQRKLFVAELRLFSLFRKSHGVREVSVVYAGAANGSHLPLLWEVINEAGMGGTWHLYDLAPFDKEVLESPHFVVHKAYFTDDTAREHAGVDIFISDIRTNPEHIKSGKDANPEFEKHVEQNMADQARWLRIVNPLMGSLKFRMPYDRSGITYPEGRIMLQAWAPLTSTETRLIVERGAPDRTYSGAEYDDRLYWYNAVAREWGHFKPAEFAPIKEELEAAGVDWCCECMHELLAWKEFVPLERIPEMVRRLSAVSKKLRSPRVWPHGYPERFWNREKFYNQAHKQQWRKR